MDLKTGHGTACHEPRLVFSIDPLLTRMECKRPGCRAWQWHQRPRAAGDSAWRAVCAARAPRVKLRVARGRFVLFCEVRTLFISSVARGMHTLSHAALASCRVSRSSARPPHRALCKPTAGTFKTNKTAVGRKCSALMLIGSHDPHPAMCTRRCRLVAQARLSSSSPNRRWASPALGYLFLLGRRAPH